MYNTTNIRAVVAFFYVHTGGLGVGSVKSVHGIKGVKNWEVTFSRHSKDVYKAILSVVEQSEIRGFQVRIKGVKETSFLCN